MRYASTTRIKVAGPTFVFLWFFIGGIAHFAATDVEMRIVPPYIPWTHAAVLVGGVFELLGAVGLLLRGTRRPAGIGLFLLTIRRHAVPHLHAAATRTVSDPALGVVAALADPDRAARANRMEHGAGETLLASMTGQRKGRPGSPASFESGPPVPGDRELHSFTLRVNEPA